MRTRRSETAHGLFRTSEKLPRFGRNRYSSGLAEQYRRTLQRRNVMIRSLWLFRAYNLVLFRGEIETKIAVYSKTIYIKGILTWGIAPRTR